MNALMSRREMLGTIAVAGASASLAASAADTAVAPPPAFAGQHKPKPLPFNPARVAGLSEKLLVSHHDNNYVGAINNLNRVEKELAQVIKDTPAFVVAGLRQSELTFRNSMTLHEAYFGNLGGDGKAAGAIAAALKSAYGSLDNWELQARGTANGLAGGSGWMVLACELETGELRTIGTTHHTLALAEAMPLMVMDMYEHAFALDYGAAAAKYIDAFFAAIDWAAVNQRWERAQKMARLLREG